MSTATQAPIRHYLLERRATLARALEDLSEKSTPWTLEDRQHAFTLSKAKHDLDQQELPVAHRLAFESYLKLGLNPSDKVFTRRDGEHFKFSGISPEDRSLLAFRDMGIGPAGGGFPGGVSGTFVPWEFAGQVESAKKSIGPMLGLITIHPSENGRGASYPLDNDATATGVVMPEGPTAQATETDIQGVNQVTIRPFKFNSQMVKMSAEMVVDSSGWDLSTYIATRLGVRIGRVLNQKLTSGSGTGEPLGFLNSALGTVAAVGSATDTGTADGTNTIGSDDMANLEHSVDQAYRANAVYMVHTDTLWGLRKLKDKNSHLVFPGLAHPTDGVLRINGYPVLVNPFMPVLQTFPSSPLVSVKSVAFGDFSRIIARADMPRVQRLDERWADYNIVGYQMFYRFDAALVDSGGAIKVLVNSY